MTRAAVITGLGGALPPRVVGNDELAARLDTSDEWIRERTGIGMRRHVNGDMSTGDLATEAGQYALKAANEPAVDMLILATTTPDHLCPATAPDVASRLGLNGIAAYDLAAVCSGFIYGLAAAAGLIATGTADRVLVIGAETFSTIVDPSDRTTAAIFGDGAGAAVVCAGDPGEPGVIGPCVLGTDGERMKMIRIPAGGARQRASGEPVGPGDNYLQMRGRDTYRHAVERTTAAAQEAMARAGWCSEDVDRLAAHQANARIVAAVADRLGIPEDRRLANIERLGNTAAASIPLLLAESVADGRLRAGDRVLLAAFGAGLTWAATTIVWPSVSAHVGVLDV